MSVQSVLKLVELLFVVVVCCAFKDHREPPTITEEE